VSFHILSLRALDESSSGDTLSAQRFSGVAEMRNIEVRAGYISPFFVTDVRRGVAELDEPYILVHENTLPGGWLMTSFIEEVLKSGRSLLVVGEHVSQEWLHMLVANKRRGNMRVAAITASQVGGQKVALLQSIATATGGLLFNDNLGINFSQFTMDMMGTAKKVIVERAKTCIIGAATSRCTVEQSLAERCDAYVAGVDGRGGASFTIGSVGKRGPPPVVSVRVTSAILDDLRRGKVSSEALLAMKQESLATAYGNVSRDTAVKARKAALLKFAEICTPNDSLK
jgi:hypothetical protein